jgi:glycosyltransferase involved in cell wall biosynthesis
MNEISIITPVYNEQDNIIPFVNKIQEVMNRINQSYELIFILDPSKDNTENVIISEINKNKNIKLIINSRRFGQPASMFAGLENSNGKYVVFIDVDLQDPPELIEEMYSNIKQDYDVVLAQRTNKLNENIFRKNIAKFGYYLISKLSDTNIPRNVGEFRMISRRVGSKLIEMQDYDFFLRGIVSFVGFKQKIIQFERPYRLIGQTKYNPYTGSIKIGLDGIFSYSLKPLHIITIISSLSFILSVLIFIFYILLTSLNLFVFKYQFFIITLILLVSSAIFFSIGIISEYLARLIPKIKQRPIYIIDKKINF